MIKNYFLTGLRNIFRQKIYSLINILGLSIGIACTILILLYIQDELSYDKYHSKTDRIYRIIEHIDPVEKSASLPFPVAEALKTDFPNYIEEYVRFFNLQAATLSIEYAPDSETKVQFNEPHVFFADSTLFKIFDFKLKTGNTKALYDPFSVLITETTAKKYFGDENPIGKNLSFEGKHDLKVTGVLEDTPANSHFKFDLIISFSSLNEVLKSGIPKVWYWNPCWTYVLLKENTDPKSLESLFPEFVTRRYPPQRAEQTSLHIQPLTGIHLNSNLDYEIEVNSDIKLVYVFGVIAFFILLIAVVNFINLSTARSFKRAREVGVRKVLGAAPKQLIVQFLSESILLTTIAVIISVPLVDLCLPVLNELASKEIPSSYLLGGFFWISLFMFIILIGLLGGIYPAIFLSSFRPAKIISGKMTRTGKGVILRKILVTAQFAVSGILIIGTIITYNQLDRLKEANLGFNKEEVIILPIDRSPIVQNYFSFKDRLIQNKNIKNVSVADLVIGTEIQSSRYTIEGSENEIPLSTYSISTDFGKTLGLNFLAGRDLSTAFPSDTAKGAILVNESFVKFAGWEPELAVGKKIKEVEELEIKGVVKDFHFTSLKKSVVPLILLLRPKAERRFAYRKFVYVRFETKEIKNVIPFLEEVHKEFDPVRAFSFSFLNERISKLYTAENSLAKIAGLFSIMAIFVACLGLYGLTSFSVEQRTKEIGIRKVLGATLSGIVLLFSKEYLKLVIVANLISWPIAYYIMNIWLDDFVYKTEVSIWIFVLAGIVAILIALLTVGFQVVRAAITNPVKSLRYE
jgi:putative ABC transport system permease protein